MGTITFNKNIGTPSDGFNIKIDLSYEQDKINNKTKITKVEGYVKRNNSSYYPSNTTSNCTLQIHGIKSDESSEILYESVTHPAFNLGSDGYKRVLYLEPNLNIEHLSNGQKKIAVYFAFDGKLNNWYPNGCVLEQYILPSIARASTIGVLDANIGSSTVITINKADNNFTTTIKYKAQGKTSYTSIVEKTSLQSYSWQVPTSFYDITPNSKTMTCEFVAETYSGNDLIGTSEVTATFTATGAPNINSVSAIDTNSATVALTGDNTKMVRHKSNVKVSVAATAQNKANISSIKVNNVNTADGQTTFNASSTNIYEVVVTDSRGYVTTQTYTMNLIEYVVLTLNATAERKNSTDDEVVLDFSGNFFNGNFSSSKTNTLSVRYKVLQGDTTKVDWTSLTLTKNGNTYSGKVTLSGFNYNEAYTLEIQAQDSLMYSDKITQQIAKSTPVWAYGEDWFDIYGVANDFNIKSPYLSTNAGDYKYSGLHMFGPNATGLPYSSYWAVLCIGKGNDCVQIAVNVLETNIRYIREVSGAWKVLGTNIVDGDRYESHISLNGTNVAGLRKNLGKLPNNSNTTYSTGLSTDYKIADYDLYAIKGNQTLKLPFLALNLNNKIAGYLDDANTVSVSTNWDASEYDLWIDIKFA